MPVDVATLPAGIPVERKGRSLRHVWSYLSEHGQVFGHVARYDDAEGRKSFRPFFEWNGTQWKAGAEKGSAPALRAYSLQGDKVYVAEGEKCAAALHSLGLAAVTWPGGSNAAHVANWNPIVRFSEICILPDNDDAGGKCARSLADILARLPGCRKVYLCELPGLPDKGDIVDWLQSRISGWTGFDPVPREPGDGLLDEFLEQVEDCSQLLLDRQDGLTPVDLSPWYTKEPPTLEFVFLDVLPRGTLTGIVAQGGLGKGWFTQQLITSLAIGRELVQGFTPSGAMRVLWVESEDPAEEIHRRHAKIVCAFDITEAEHQKFVQNVRLYAGKAFPLVRIECGNVLPTEQYNELRSIAEEFQPDLIVVDPLSHYFGGEENDNVIMAAFMNHLKALSEDPKTTVWVNHHVSKEREAVLSSAMARGASAFRDATRSLFAMVPLDEQDKKKFGISDEELYVAVGHTKANWTRRTGGTTYLKRDVSSSRVSGVLRTVDLASDEESNARELKERAANELAVIIGDNHENLTERQIAREDEGGDIRYELEKKFPRFATTRAVAKLLTHAESAGYTVVEKKGRARIPRKSKIIMVGFAEESEQADASEQTLCSNTQSADAQELSESAQMAQ